MFSIRICQVSGCRRHATERADTCFDHLPDQTAYLADLRLWLESRREFSGLSLGRQVWQNLDLRGKSFEGSNFTGCRWEDIQLDGSDFRHCFFDFGNFKRCSFKTTSLLFCSVSGSGWRTAIGQVRTSCT